MGVCRCAHCREQRPQLRYKVGLDYSACFRKRDCFGSFCHSFMHKNRCPSLERLFLLCTAGFPVVLLVETGSPRLCRGDLEDFWSFEMGT